MRSTNILSGNHYTLLDQIIPKVKQTVKNEICVVEVKKKIKPSRHYWSFTLSNLSGI